MWWCPTSMYVRTFSTRDCSGDIFTPFTSFLYPAKVYWHSWDRKQNWTFLGNSDILKPLFKFLSSVQFPSGNFVNLSSGIWALLRPFSFSALASKDTKYYNPYSAQPVIQFEFGAYWVKSSHSAQNTHIFSARWPNSHPSTSSSSAIFVNWGLTHTRAPSLLMPRDTSANFVRLLG